MQGGDDRLENRLHVGVDRAGWLPEGGEAFLDERGKERAGLGGLRLQVVERVAGDLELLGVGYLGRVWRSRQLERANVLLEQRLQVLDRLVDALAGIAVDERGQRRLRPLGRDDEQPRHVHLGRQAEVGQCAGLELEAAAALE